MAYACLSPIRRKRKMKKTEKLQTAEEEEEEHCERGREENGCTVEREK
ncbi:hypothetical protein CCACVL1_20048 [Corchorus capsularis]|uniref:Uncharacterized protein n=1 Tax=Corchorus capsularis TaxID=210143 RepID=A0A1R3HCU8_COCAP|nr:hypothetical protein CCACVL1_20048 [Corchorus capsularis]